MDTDENVVVEEIENALEEETGGGVEKPRARTAPKPTKSNTKVDTERVENEMEEREVGDTDAQHNEPKRCRGRPRTRAPKEPMPKGYMSEAKQLAFQKMKETRAMNIERKKKEKEDEMADKYVKNLLYKKDNNTIKKLKDAIRKVEIDNDFSSDDDDRRPRRQRREPSPEPLPERPLPARRQTNRPMITRRQPQEPKKTGFQLEFY